MPKIDDGGPAFPMQRRIEREDGSWIEFIPGMSLRVWLAGQALAGILANSKVATTNSERVEMAFGFADLMLAERAKDREA